MSSFNIILGKSGVKLKEEDLVKSIRVNPEEEAKELYERIKKRAEDEAKKIIENAYKEADRIKKEVFLAAKKEADKVLENKRDVLAKYAEELENFITSLKNEKEKFLNSYKSQLVEFIKIAAEKTFNVILEDKYCEIFFSLIQEAADKIDVESNVKLIINKKDLPLVKELFSTIGSDTFKGWEILVREDVDEGTVIVETPTMVIDNSIPMRMKQLKDKISKLSSL